MPAGISNPIYQKNYEQLKYRHNKLKLLYDNLLAENQELKRKIE